MQIKELHNRMQSINKGRWEEEYNNIIINIIIKYLYNIKLQDTDRKIENGRKVKKLVCKS